jgi:hypothetical protein
MKKSTLIIAFCVSVISLFAQDEVKKEKQSGIRLGYGNSTLIKNSKEAKGNLDQFYGGFTHRFKIAKLFRLETGLEYTGAGAKLTDSSKLQLHYIVLPVQGMLKLGPLIGLVGANGNFRVAEERYFLGEKISVSDNNKSEFFDLTLDAGVGINIFFMTIEARYYWGMLNVTDDWMNRYWQVGLNFHF